MPESEMARVPGALILVFILTSFKEATPVANRKEVADGHILDISHNENVHNAQGQGRWLFESGSNGRAAQDSESSNARDHSNNERTHPEASRPDSDLPVVMDSSTLFFKPEHNEPRNDALRNGDDHSEEEGDRKANKDTFMPRSDKEKTKGQQSTETSEPENLEMLASRETKNTRKLNDLQVTLEPLVDVARKLDVWALSKSNTRGEKSTRLRYSVVERLKKAKFSKAFRSNIRSQNSETKELQGTYSKSQLPRRDEYFTRYTEPETDQFMKKLMIKHLNAVKHRENQKLIMRLEALITDHFINLYKGLMRKANTKLLEDLVFILQRLITFREWYAVEFKSPQRIRTCYDQFALNFIKALKERRKILNLLLSYKCKSFAHLCLLNAKALDLLSKFYGCALKEQGYQRPLHPTNDYLQRMRTLNRLLLYKNSLAFNGPQALRNRGKGGLKSVLDVLVSRKITNEPVRKAVLMSKKHPVKLNSKHLLRADLNSLKAKLTILSKDAARLVYGKRKDNKAYETIENRPKYTISTLASPGRTRALLTGRLFIPVLTSAKISETKIKKQENDKVSRNFAYSDGFDESERGKQASSSSLIRHVRTLNVIVENSSAMPYRISTIKDVNRNQSCKLASGFFSYLSCMGNFVINTALEGIEFLVKLIKKAFVLLQDILKRLYDEIIWTYQWLFQMEPDRVIEREYNATGGTSARRDSESFTFEEDGRGDQNLVASNRSTTRERQAETSIVTGNISDENTMNLDKPKRIKGRSQRPRNPDAWQYSDNKYVSVSSLPKISVINDANVKLPRQNLMKMLTRNKAAELSFSENTTPLKFRHPDVTSIQEGLVHQRSRRHLVKDVGKITKNVQRPQVESPGAEARAMTKKLLKLMTLAKDYTDHHPVHASSPEDSNENVEYDIGTMRQNNRSNDGNIDLLADDEPTEADRQLLKNIEQLTFSVIGRNIDGELWEPQTKPRPHTRREKYPNKSMSNGKILNGSHKKRPDKRVYIASTTSKTKNGDASHLTNKLQKTQRRTGRIGPRRKAKTGLRNNKLLRVRHPIVRPIRTRNTYRRKPRYQRDVKAVQRMNSGESITSISDRILRRHKRAFQKTRKVRHRKETKQQRSNSYRKSKTSSKQRRSLDTIDLMDDFRLLWPPLRAKAIDLVDAISNLKTTYDAAIDDLSHSIKIGDDYNKDAAELAKRDLMASAYLQKETEKLSAAETDFEKYQRQIANEEKLTMDFERKANELSKSPVSLLFAARTLPEATARVTLNDITLGEPMLSVPAPETALHKVPLDYHNRAGLKSALLNLKPVHRFSHDENLGMLASDLSEITSRAELNMKGPARRRRSTVPNSMSRTESQRRKRDETHKQKAVARKSKVRGEKHKKKTKRGKRAAKGKDLDFQKPLKKCKSKQQPTETIQPAPINPNDKNAAVKYDSLAMPKGITEGDKSTVSGNNQKATQDVSGSGDISQRNKINAINQQIGDANSDLGRIASESNLKSKKDYETAADFDIKPQENTKSLKDQSRMEILKDKALQNFIKEQEKVIKEPSSFPKPDLDIQQKKRKDENVSFKVNEPRKKDKDLNVINRVGPEPTIDNQQEKRKEEKLKSEIADNYKKELEKIEADTQEAIVKPKSKNQQQEDILFDNIDLSKPTGKKLETFNFKPDNTEKILKTKAKVREEKAPEAEATKLDKIAAEYLKNKPKLNEAVKIPEAAVLKSIPKVKGEKEKNAESSNIKLDKMTPEEFNLQSQPKLKVQQEKAIEKENNKLDKIAAAELGLQSQSKGKAQPEKYIDKATRLDKIAAQEINLQNQPKLIDQSEKSIDKANNKLDKIAAKELDLATNPVLNNPPTIVKSEKAPNPMNSMDLSLKVKPNVNNKQEGMDASGVDLKAPESSPTKNEDTSLANLRKKREERGEGEEKMASPLNRTRRRVIDYSDASFVDNPDVGNVIVGFHGLNYKGDQHDVLDNVEEDTDEEETLLDDGEYGGVDGDAEDLHGENLLELDVESDPLEDCLDDDPNDYDDAEDDGFAGAKRLEDIAPAEASDWARAHAVKQWDDIGADIQLYAAPDRDTPEEIMRYKDPVVEAEKAQMDLIGSGKDLENDLEAELMTPKKDPVIEGLMAPGIRQEEKDTINEARFLDTIPSLNTIEDVSGVLKAAGRDLQQELRMRDMGVDVDKLLNEGDLDPYNELMGDSMPEDVNRKYMEYFGRTSLSGPVQHEIRDIVNTRQKADKAFQTLRKSETLVDESILPAHMKTALDEQLDDSIVSIRREQKRNDLQGKIFEREEQAREADAIRDLEQNNESLIDQRMRQTEQLDEDLKAAASDQVEIAARRSKMLHELGLQAG